MDAMADPGYWMEHFQPRFTEAEPVASEPDPMDMEPEDTPTIRSSDSKEWWSDYYKLARKYLYGNKVEKPDFQKVMPLLLLEANRGNGYACYDLGRMHLMGQGCEEDEEEAQRWFRDALEAFQVVKHQLKRKATCGTGSENATHTATGQSRTMRNPPSGSNRRWTRIIPSQLTPWLDSTSGGRVLNRAMRKPTAFFT